jgi:hypothetical protein
MNDTAEQQAANPSAIDWPTVRARYEKGEEAVKAIAASINMSWAKLSGIARSEGWHLRRGGQARSQSTQATLKRLKDILHNRLVKLEAEIAAIGDDIDKLNSEKGYRNLNTLVRTLDKVLELERNERKSRRKPDTFKHVDDAERDALAGKLDRLGRPPADAEDSGSALTLGGEGA